MKALSSFKSFMAEGNNDLGIPRLDPVHMNSFNYSYGFLNQMHHFFKCHTLKSFNGFWQILNIVKRRDVFLCVLQNICNICTITKYAS